MSPNTIVNSHWQMKIASCLRRRKITRGLSGRDTLFGIMPDRVPQIATPGCNRLNFTE